jgi:hypothetical protein
MMLSLTNGEPDGYQQIEIKARKGGTQIAPHGKTRRQEQSSDWIEADHRFEDYRYENGVIEITCGFIV